MLIRSVQPFAGALLCGVLFAGYATPRGSEAASAHEVDAQGISTRDTVTHEVRMIGDEQGFRFEPADLKVQRGDRITFVLVSGGPHNVAFDPAQLPDAVEPRIASGMPDRISELAGPLLVKPGSRYTIALDGVPAGKYPYFCMPHMAMGMTGTITVR